jgi:hypothetical protein
MRTQDGEVCGSGTVWWGEAPDGSAREDARPTKNRKVDHHNVCGAHKLARIRWHLIKHRTPYDPTVWQYAGEKLRQKKIRRLHQNAAALGFKLLTTRWTYTPSFSGANQPPLRTLSQKKLKRLPSTGGLGELSANRKGSCRPACHWCSYEPVHGAWPRVRRPYHWWRA